MKYVLAPIAILLFPILALAAPGDLDPTFGTGGVVRTVAVGADFGRSIAIQPDGKIVLAGWTEPGGVGPLMQLIRYNPDGTLDSSFGSGGVVLGQDSTRGWAVAIQPDGKIVVAGTQFTGANADTCIWRFNPNGTPDITFNGTGRRVKEVSFFFNDEFYGMTLQADGKIVAVGTARHDDNVNHDFVVARFNTDGTFDNTWDLDGIAITPMDVGNDTAWAVGIQNDGQVVVTGSGGIGAFTTSLAIARYNSFNGSLDTSFDTDGKVLRNLTTFDIGSAVTFQQDNKIVIAGTSGDLFSIFRFNTNGSHDPTFNGSGRRQIGFSNSWARAVMIQRDGKIVAVGDGAAGISRFFGAVRILSDGSNDTTFGPDGFFVTTSFGASAQGHAYAAAIQRDGNIIAAGQVIDGPPSSFDFALVRYVGGPYPSLIVTNLNNSGPGSLRQVVADIPPGGVVTFQPGLTGTTVLASQISFSKNLTIQGPGRDVIAVSGNDAVRIFNIGNGTTPYDVRIHGLKVTNAGQNAIAADTVALEMSDCEVSNELVDSPGSPISVVGSLIMQNCHLHDNANASEVVRVSPSFFGGLRGGIVSDSTFSNNTAWGSKVGIFGVTDGLTYFTVLRSTFINNVTGECGSAITAHAFTAVTVRDTSILNNQKGNGCQIGGAAIDNSGHLVVMNSTISGNSVVQVAGFPFAASGAAISGNRFGASGSMLIVNSTITNNTGWNDVGGIFNGGITNSLQIRNSIIAGNHAPSNPDINFSNGSAISLGHNIIGNIGTAPLSPAAGDQFGTSKSPIDPMLGALANNGGPTMTHELLPGSPAIDAGDNCVTETPGCLVTPLLADQRGFSRVGGGGLGISAVDIGAFELLAPTAAHVSIAGRVTDVDGRAISRVRVILEDSAGAIRSTATNPFGYFRFDDVEAGRTYLIRASHKSYTFEPRAVQVFDEIVDMIITASTGAKVGRVSTRE